MSYQRVQDLQPATMCEHMAPWRMEEYVPLRLLSVGVSKKDNHVIRENQSERSLHPEKTIVVETTGRL